MARKNPEQDRAYGRVYMKAYRIAYPEKVRASGKAYDAAHREERKAYARAYRHAHREELRVASEVYRIAHQDEYNATSKAYRITHREEIQAKTNAWRIAHPEQRAEQAQRRRARKANAPMNDFTAQQWRDMQAAYDHRCAYCGKRAKGHLTQDHITPLSQGGSHTLSNIVPACQSCNSKKHTGPPLTPVQPFLL